MTDHPGTGPYAIDPAPLPGGRGQGRRAGVALAAVVTVLAGAFGIARLSDVPPAAPEGSLVGRAAPSTSSGHATPASASPVSSTAPPRPSSARVERLVEAGSEPLPGSPEVTLVERTGEGMHDLRISVWTPDDGRTRTIRTIRGAIPEADVQPAFPIVAPNRRHLLILTLSRRADPSSDAARLLDDDGSVLWTGEDLAASSGALWSADSRLVVVAGLPRRWSLVRIDRPGHATERRLDLPSAIFLPTPIPPGSLSPLMLEPRTVPLGFSADGRWIYGGVISPELGLLVGAFRVSADGATVEPLRDFRVGQPDGLVPRPGTSGRRTVDPATGRVASSRINSDTTGGPQTVEVREPDASFVFSVAGPITLGEEWGGDGSLYALTANTLVFPDEVALTRIDANGMAGPPIVQTGPLTSAAFVGVRDGYAVLALLASRPNPGAELLVVDVADPSRMTARSLTLDGSEALIAASLDR